TNVNGKNTIANKKMDQSDVELSTSKANEKKILNSSSNTKSSKFKKNDEKAVRNSSGSIQTSKKRKNSLDDFPNNNNRCQPPPTKKINAGGAVGSYGHKAYNDFAATRGKDFRAQKTKKKRGSYRGGKIDFQSHSIKFED
ncbi:15024_t:CDS:2, partial [Racocetra fulgida]